MPPASVSSTLWSNGRKRSCSTLRGDVLDVCRARCSSATWPCSASARWPNAYFKDEPHTTRQTAITFAKLGAFWFAAGMAWIALNRRNGAHHMITAQPQDQQTGTYSRIVNPRLCLTPDAIQARVHSGTNPQIPGRTQLSGAGGTGIFCRLAAWLRGE